jgi:uncharacterized surface protein with fasciclin (FAS1) repeats
MTASYGSWQYQDLIQTYSLTDNRQYPCKKLKPDMSTVMGFLENPEFSIFKYIVETSQMNVKMSQDQFNSTVFVCDDSVLRKKYGESFFMNLDRNTALTILNFHIIPRSISYKTLLQNKVAKLDTKNPRSEIIFFNDSGTIILNNQATVLKETQLNNGIIYTIDGLLIPENFMLC